MFGIKTCDNPPPQTRPWETFRLARTIQVRTDRNFSIFGQTQIQLMRLDNNNINLYIPENVDSNYHKRVCDNRISGASKVLRSKKKNYAVSLEKNVQCKLSFFS